MVTLSLSPKCITITILLFLSLISSCFSTCTSPTVIFNFGDSNSDTGGLVSGLGFSVYPPNGRSFFRKSTGRLSDGRLLIDFLCQSVKTSLLRPYLDSMGSTFRNGANFAVVGSSTLPKFIPFSLSIQLMQFFHFKAKSLELVNEGLGDWINEEGFENALYMIDIGQNDLADSFSKNLSFVGVSKIIPSVVTEIKNAIKAIYDQGGRKFWIHNTGPLGCLPQKLALVHDRVLDKYGCISSYNDAARLFNEALRHLCREMRLELKDSTIVYVDIFSIKYDLIANSTSYGFTSPFEACCGNGGPPYNYNVHVGCGHIGYQVCGERSRFVSWDGIHYTEAANSFVAAKILTKTYSTPPVGFDFFCR